MQLENNLLVEVNEHPNLYSMPTVPTAILCCAYDAENTYCTRKPLDLRLWPTSRMERGNLCNRWLHSAASYHFMVKLIVRLYLERNRDRVFFFLSSERNFVSHPFSDFFLFRRIVSKYDN